MTPALLALVLGMLPHQEASDVSSLFKAFRNSFGTSASTPVHKPKEPIKLYATDDGHTQMCYISGDRIFIYSNGQTTIPLFAKVFNVQAVNRITYRKSPVGGAFLLWIDDELTLSIGA